MTKLVCLLFFTALSVTFADQELQALVQQIHDLLNPHGSNGNQNSALLSLTNGESFSANISQLLGNSSHKLQVNVTFTGSIQVSAQRDNKKVEIKSQYNGGAALKEEDKENEKAKFVEPQEPQLNDKFLEDIYEQNLRDQSNLDDETVGVIVGHAAATGFELRDNKFRAKAKLQGGYIVGSKTTVKTN